MKLTKSYVKTDLFASAIFPNFPAVVRESLEKVAGIISQNEWESC